MKNFGYLYAILAAVSWGLVYTIDQKLLTKLSPLVLIFFNSLFAFAVTLPLVLYKPGSAGDLVAGAKANWFWLVTSQLLVIVASYFILSAVKSLGAATASILEIMYPFFVVAFTYFFFGQTVNAFFFVGAALIFAGAAIIIRFS